MSKQILSPWFSTSKEDKPVNVGVYPTQLVFPSGDILEGWSRWNGEYWMDTVPTKKKAASARLKGEQDKLWRGIVK